VVQKKNCLININLFHRLLNTAVTPWVTTNDGFMKEKIVADFKALSDHHPQSNEGNHEIP
jgi:hypothetical protein